MIDRHSYNELRASTDLHLRGLFHCSPVHPSTKSLHHEKSLRMLFEISELNFASLFFASLFQRGHRMRWARGLGGASWWPFGLAAGGNGA